MLAVWYYDKTAKKHLLIPYESMTTFADGHKGYNLQTIRNKPFRAPDFLWTHRSAFIRRYHRGEGRPEFVFAANLTPKQRAKLRLRSWWSRRPGFLVTYMALATGWNIINFIYLWAHF
jgi:hypothetical protein